MRFKRTKHLDRTMDVAAHIWNHSAALDRRYSKRFGRSLKHAQLQERLAKLRITRFQHWQLVDSQSLQAVTNRIYRGWDAWFKREIQWRPTLRSRPKYTRFTLKQSGWKLLGLGKVRLQSRVCRLRQSREIAGTTKTLTTSRDGAATSRRIQDVALGERTVRCRRCDATPDRDVHAA